MARVTDVEQIGAGKQWGKATSQGPRPQWRVDLHPQALSLLLGSSAHSIPRSSAQKDMSCRKGGLFRLQGSKKCGASSPGEEDWLAVGLCFVPQGALPSSPSCLLTTTQTGVEPTGPIASQMRRAGLTGAKQLPRIIVLGRQMQTQVFSFKKIHPSWELQ